MQGIPFLPAITARVVNLLIAINIPAVFPSQDPGSNCNDLFWSQRGLGPNPGHFAFYDLEYVSTLFCFLILKMDIATPTLQSCPNNEKE